MLSTDILDKCTKSGSLVQFTALTGTFIWASATVVFNFLPLSVDKNGDEHFLSIKDPLVDLSHII